MEGFPKKTEAFHVSITGLVPNLQWSHFMLCMLMLHILRHLQGSLGETSLRVTPGGGKTWMQFPFKYSAADVIVLIVME